MGVNGSMYATIQVHYTNPNGVSGELDSSGIRVYYDTVATTYLGGVLALGDEYLQASPLPANTASIHLELSCPNECTRLLSKPLTVFGSFLHMHGHGRMAYSTITSVATGVTSTINRIEFYDFEFQQITPVNVQVNPGDRLNTHCIYSTLGNSSDVTFGVSTDQEMCIEFQYYYPKISVTACTLYTATGSNTTQCGAATSGVNNPPLTDPSSLLMTTFGTTQATSCPKSASSWRFTHAVNLSLFAIAIMLLL